MICGIRKTDILLMKIYNKVIMEIYKREIGRQFIWQPDVILVFELVSWKNNIHVLYHKDIELLSWENVIEVPAAVPTLG